MGVLYDVSLPSFIVFLMVLEFCVYPILYLDQKEARMIFQEGGMEVKDSETFLAEN